MTYFKLDIPKLNESISRYEETKKESLEDINMVYNGLEYTESAWNDINAFDFIKTTKSDKKKIKDYFNYLDSLYNEINTFKTNIDVICSKQGYKRDNIIFKFDDKDMDACKKYLDNAVTYLNDSLEKINISQFTTDFKYISLINDLKTDLTSIINSINDLKTDIDYFVNYINQEIYDSKLRIKKIDNLKLNLKLYKYNWKIVDLY